MTVIASCFSFFYTTLLSFPTAILSLALLIGVDIKGHSFALLGLIQYMHALFWFILRFSFLCFPLGSIRCITPSLN